MSQNIAKTINSIKNLGVRDTLFKVYSRVSLDTWREGRAYKKWIAKEEVRCEENLTLAYRPKISIIVPVYNVEDRYLVECIESVKAQTYDNWELCIADDCSTMSSVRKTLARYEDGERIKVVYRSKNGHISECSNSALELATGEFVALLDCDDMLAPNALYEVVKKLNEDKSYDLIYSDEDKVDDNGENRHRPHFKPDWSPDTLMAHMYICHLSVYRTECIREVGGFRKGFEGSQDYDLALRVTERTNRIAHIPKVLYHWRERKESTAANPGSKPYFVEAARKAKADALARRGIEATLEYIAPLYLYRVIYTLPDAVRIHEISSADFDKANAVSDGVIIFHREGVQIENTEMRDRLAAHAMASHSGAVSTKTLKKGSHRIFQTGKVIAGGQIVSLFYGKDDRRNLYFFRNQVEYNYDIISGDYFAIEAKKFHAIGGWKENLSYEVAVIDLCLRLLEKGYYNVVCNDVVARATAPERIVSVKELPHRAKERLSHQAI